MVQFVWLVPAFPLLGFLIISFGKKFFSDLVAGILGSLSILAAFVISLVIFISLNGEATTVHVFDWITVGSLSIPLSFLVDQISAIMLLIITGVGFLIHVYSIGYMHNDRSFHRFFAHMNLFVFFMLLLVLGSNFIVLFTGWEGVGLCSYLLIGFWFQNKDYNRAADKAFIMNRIGDLGFLLGIILIYYTFGSVSFDVVFPAAKQLPINDPAILAITSLLFIGAMGKSAQLPLYTWLPDAMAGPTPVSALIHAATMVTAGIYMVVRSSALYSIAPAVLSIIAVIGTATALFAAAIAVAQTDIKKILAYSTISQLGYMFAALGVGAYSSAMFHLTTHAFFKALLFLAAGSVIHALSGEQDIRKMGGLRKKLPITFWVFAIGTFAISGIPPFAGFFSKDEILAHVWVHNKILFTTLAITSVLTAFYMFRLFFLTFYGTFRGTSEQEHHAHESPPVITIPLMALAVLSAIGGFMGLPHILSNVHMFSNFLDPALTFPAEHFSMEPTVLFEWSLIIISIITLIIIIIAAFRTFVTNNKIPPLEEAQLKPAVRLAFNKFYVDELYDKTIVTPIYRLGDLFYNFLDLKIIDGIIRAINKIIIRASQTLRYAQNGNIGFYIFAMVFGIITILIYNLIIT